MESESLLAYRTSPTSDGSRNPLLRMAAPTFPNRLPKERLGVRHKSLDAFQRAIIGTSAACPIKKESKEYTLVIVTESAPAQQTSPSSSSSQAQQYESSSRHHHGGGGGPRILLGMKNRGFGTGKFNSFGGKFENNETVEECACRELEEETNINIPLQVMSESKVGLQRFTFDDEKEKEMIVHLFHIDLSSSSLPAFEVIGCDEITPKWFDDFDLVPFDNMFADDSLWLTTLLSSLVQVTPGESAASAIEINGSYHFKENCEETNTILHYHMDVRPKQNLKME